MTVRCPNPNEMTIVLVTLTDNDDEGKLIHNEYRWTDGAFLSPLHRDRVEFGSGSGAIVSDFTTITGNQGGGVIPSDNATVKMLSNKLTSDTFDFDAASDKFRYLRTDTSYTNTPTSIRSLLAASSSATPIVEPTLGVTSHSAEFSMPASGQRLYLIWDYREATAADLCFGANIEDSCCDCV